MPTAPPDPVRVFIRQMEATVAARTMLKGGEKVLLAVSGGADSLSMLHAFVRLRKRLDVQIEVAHFDHRLREGSDKDARFVAREAQKLDLPFHPGVAEETEPVKGQSPEESARNRRRAFLNAVAKQHGFDRIATAHTLDDQAETVLMHVLLGAGRRGISGIPPVRWRMIRPLIDLRRADTEAFCRALKLKPRHDPTNDDRSFLRNSIRHDALPYLTTNYNARLSEALARMADIQRDEDRLLDKIASDAGAPEPREGGYAVELATLRAMPVALQRRLIRLCARVAGPGISAAHIERVRALAEAGKDGKRLDLPGSIEARIEGGELILGDTRATRPPVAPVELNVPGETELAGWGLTVNAFISSEAPERLPDGKGACVLDADRCALPLRVRRVAPGDRFQPLGMTGAKKVGDYFTDRKVPVRDRGSVPLVEDAKGAIVWLIGHGISHRARILPGTRTILHLTAEEA